MKMMPLLNFKMKSAIINHNVDFCVSSWILQCFLFFFGLKSALLAKMLCNCVVSCQNCRKWQIISHFKSEKVNNEHSKLKSIIEFEQKVHWSKKQCNLHPTILLNIDITIMKIMLNKKVMFTSFIISCEIRQQL